MKELEEWTIKELISLHKQIKSNAFFVLLQMACLLTIIIGNWVGLASLKSGVIFALLCVAIMTSLPKIIILIGEIKMIKHLEKGLKELEDEESVN